MEKEELFNQFLKWNNECTDLYDRALDAMIGNFIQAIRYIGSFSIPEEAEEDLELNFVLGSIDAERVDAIEITSDGTDVAFLVGDTGYSIKNIPTPLVCPVINFTMEYIYDNLDELEFY